MPDITGYRPLSQEEIALINDGKELAEQVGHFIDQLSTGHPLIDQRWLAIAKTCSASVENGEGVLPLR